MSTGEKNGKKPTRSDVLNAVIPSMARFQKSLEDAISEGTSGRHSVSVWLSKGAVTKVQVTAENTQEL